MVVVWTALSFGVPSKVPSGVPRRLFSPLPWESVSLQHWTVIKVSKTIFSNEMCHKISVPSLSENSNCSAKFDSV